MKRILSLLLSVVLVLTLMPVQPLQVQAKTGGKLVALTFDDGPSSKYTTQLLDGLKERGVPVTFFMLGEMAEDNRAIVRRAYEEGHEIACHSWDHPNLTGCSESEVKKQMEDTFEELDRACGDEADYLVRPPYGSTNQKVRDAIDAPLIYWSVDSEDWSLLNTTKVRKKIVEDTYDGCIILCHDIHKTTIPAALGAIDDLMELGYEFVTVSELYRRRGRELQDHKLHYNSNKNGIDYGPIPAPKISFTGDPKGVNTVTITCSDPDVPLYYTLDGSYPNQSAKRYTGPFTVPYGTQVTAVAAYKLNGSRSALTVKSADQIQVVAPTITLDESGDVVMSTPTVNSEIYFTIDDSVPNADSLRYIGPESIAGGCFLRAVTVHSRGTSGDIRVYLSEDGDLYYDMYDGQWFYGAMDWAHRSGILNGTAPYTMDPAGTVTRGMLVTLLYRFSGAGLEEGWERTNAFADVNQSFYYAEAIEWAYRNHIVDGYSAEAFGPDDLVTRQQMCKIVAGFLAFNGTPLHSAESCEGLFADYDQLAPWALESVDAMVAAGLIQGDGTNLNPNAGTNRAQFCVVLTRLVTYIEEYVPEEADHTHQWMLNIAQNGSLNWASVTIDEGESLELQILCSVCGEPAEVEWEADPDGVVLVEDGVITGILGGNSALVWTLWEDMDYECLIYVRAEEGLPTEPSEPEPTDPTEPEPSEPSEPTEPEHTHTWKLNKARGEDPTWGEVSIDVGETFRLYIFCTECKEAPEVEWTADPDGVVLVEEDMITGILGSKNARVRAQWEGVTYECLIHVRKDTSVTEPTEPEPTEPEPTEPEPTEPSEPTEPTEPEHIHTWKLNKARGEDPTWGEVSIDVGETFRLYIFCTECKEAPEVEWTADPDGVVLVEEDMITGILGSKNARVRAQWEGVTYECLIHVRKDTSVTEPTEPEPTEPEPTEPEPTEPEPTDPTEPEPDEPDHVHSWKLNKALSGSLTEGDVSIRVGEWFNLRILCTHKGCEENAPITWTPSREGVVNIEGMRITGVKSGSNTTLSAEWEGVTYSCIIRVRKQTSSLHCPIILD